MSCILQEEQEDLPQAEAHVDQEEDDEDWSDSEPEDIGLEQSTSRAKRRDLPRTEAELADKKAKLK